MVAHVGLGAGQVRLGHLIEEAQPAARAASMAALSSDRSVRRIRCLTGPIEAGRIDALVKSNDVVLFMKGTALFPQCGFSSRAIAILEHLGTQYETVDVLQDQEIRQGIKEYSDWPTIPQLYVKGEFVGGCDIIREMFQAGELAGLLKDKGVPVKEQAGA